MLIFFIALLAIIITFTVKNSFRPKNYPPGPICLPLIGSCYTVPGQGIDKKVAEWKKKYGNIIGHKMGLQNLVVVTGYNEVISGLKNPNFQNRMHTSTLTFRTFNKVLGLFTADGEQYNEVRRFSLRYLVQVSGNKLEPVMREEMMNLFSTIELGKVIQVNGEFMSFFMNTIFTFLVGNINKSMPDETKTFRELIYHSFRNGRAVGIENFYSPLGIFFNRKPQIVATKYGQEFFRQLLKEHRESFNEENIRDYIDAYLLEQEKQKQTGQTQYYTDEELLSCLLDLGSASSESVGNTAAFLLMYVVLHPKVQDEIQKELDNVLESRYPTLEDKSSLPYCNAVIYETIRMNPIAATLAQHIVTEDTEFYGYTIPTGTMMVFPLSDVFQNPEKFDNPGSFKPERFTSKEMRNKLFAFGLGKHACIGELMSKNLLFLFVTYFFQKYSLSLPKGYEILDTEPITGFTNCPKPFKLYIEERQKI